MPDTSQAVVTRFAPSPTGALHVGGARTALFAWAFARGRKGRFILRFEDTDLARSTPESTRGILRDLQWLGIDWDEGPDPDATNPYDPAGQIGERGPYFQSQRKEAGIYDRYVEQLLKKNAAYEDDGAVRFRMDKAVAFDDEVYGRIEVTADNLEDFIIRKGEAGGFMPTFHLAVVVDDALMNVTHVLRGQEHLYNTTKHVALQDALGFPRPVYAHMPSIMNPDGSKMSKRDKAKTARQAAVRWIEDNDPQRIAILAKDAGIADVADLNAFVDKMSDEIEIAEKLAAALHVPLPEIEVKDFRNSGYLPDVLCNYIALLGWNPGDNVERFDQEFLCREFSLERMNKANSRFDREKLAAFNGDAIQQKLSAEEFSTLLRKHWQMHHPEALEKIGDLFETFAAAYQPRSRTLDDAWTQGQFLLDDCNSIPYDFSPKNIRKVMQKNDGEGFRVLEQLREQFADLPADHFGDAAHELIRQLAEKAGGNMGNYAQPLRVAVSGTTVTPPLDATLNILGKDGTLARIDRCIAARPQDG